MKLIEALAYDDVTLIPQYSELTSRSQASPRMKDFSLPIIASCMDTLGRKMKDTCVKHYIPFICHRSFKSAKEQIHYFLGTGENTFSYTPADADCLWFAVGSVGKYREWIDELIDTGIRHFCVDMAHGDSKSCIDTIKYIRQKVQEKIIKGDDRKIQSKLHIIAGNVATPEGFKRLQEAGANGIRIGIASGCWTGDMEVETMTGIKKMKDIKVGDIVLTHKNNWKKVIATKVEQREDQLIRINNYFESTLNHEYFVIGEQRYKNKITIDNYLNYGEWVSAEELLTRITEYNMDYKLVEISNNEIKLIDICSMQKFNYDGPVYDLTVQDDHSYNIKRIAVHNSICSTALNTGFGVPILTNIIECAKVRKKGIWIIADGGVKNIGDIAKAVFFGANFCMLGKMLAATSDSEGTCYNSKKEEIKGTPIYPDMINEDDPIVKSNIVKYKAYRGMASRGARKGILSYASVEGVEGLIKYTRSTEAFINDTILQLQASLSYGGSRNWEEFRKKVKACRRSNSGIMAADTHLYITRDA